MIFPLLALLGLGFLLSSKKGGASKAPPARPPPLMQEQQRIVREMEEIATGKRAELSDPPLPLPAAPALPAAVDVERSAEGGPSDLQGPAVAPNEPSDEQALAEAAARAAMAQEGGSAPSASAVRPKAGKAAAKPAAAPAKPVNMALAKSTAAQVAAHLKAKKMNYDRKMLALWQGRAGVPVDGIYGRGSAAALKYFTKNAPPALFAQGTSSYTPPA